MGRNQPSIIAKILAAEATIAHLALDSNYLAQC